MSDDNPLGYCDFGGFRIRGMHGFVYKQGYNDEKKTDGDLIPQRSIFEWQKRDLLHCQKLYTAGAVGHINAVGMGMGKTIAVIAECLAIRDGIIKRPDLFVACRDGALERNNQYDRLRSVIELAYNHRGANRYFKDRKAWTDRAWFYLSMGMTDVADLQMINYRVAMHTHEEFIHMWRHRHQRMISMKHTVPHVLPEGVKYDCTKLLVLKKPPVLVVCGSSFASEWFRELENLTPGSVKVLNLACDYNGVFKYQRLRYTAGSKYSMMQDIAEGDYDFVFVTYGYLGNAYAATYKSKHGISKITRSGNTTFIEDDSVSKDTRYRRENREYFQRPSVSYGRNRPMTRREYLSISNRVALMNIMFSTIVVDEAHKICTNTTKRHKGVRYAKGYFKIFMTGTPIQNGISDLRSLLLALNFEHCVLYESVFQEACNVRYQMQYAQMREQYIRERSLHLMETVRKDSNHDDSVLDDTQTLSALKRVAESEISTEKCLEIAQCSRKELQCHITTASKDTNPWTLRRLFIMIMSLRQNSSGELILGNINHHQDGSNMFIQARTGISGDLPTYVNDCGESIDPIMKIVKWFFHWENTEVLKKYLVDHHCKLLLDQKRCLARESSNNVNANSIQLTKEEKKMVAKRLDVTHTTIKRDFMFDYEVDIYRAVCENTLSLIDATSDTNRRKYTDEQIRMMQSALRVPVMRMQQVCMHPAFVFLPSGEQSVKEVEFAREMVMSQLRRNAGILSKDLKEKSTELSNPLKGDMKRTYRWEHNDMYSSKLQTNLCDETKKGCGSNPDSLVTIDSLAMRKKLLVPYHYFSKVIDAKNHIIMPSTKETMLYQLFTNTLQEALVDGNPNRIITPATKILVFDIYPMVQMMHQRAATKAFGPGSSVCISGEVPQKKRDEYLHKFRTDPKVQVLFMTLETGADALNIPEGDIVVLTTVWWNPQKENQSIFRVLRPSRTHEVFVYHFVTSGTIEEHVVHKQNEKKQLISVMLMYDDPFMGILRTNKRLQTLQKIDVYTMKQVASDAIVSKTMIRKKFAESFLSKIDTSRRRDKSLEDDGANTTDVEVHAPSRQYMECQDSTESIVFQKFVHDVQNTMVSSSHILGFEEPSPNQKRDSRDKIGSGCSYQHVSQYQSIQDPIDIFAHTNLEIHENEESDSPCESILSDQSSYNPEDIIDYDQLEPYFEKDELRESISNDEEMSSDMEVELSDSSDHDSRENRTPLIELGKRNAKDCNRSVQFSNHSKRRRHCFFN